MTDNIKTAFEIWCSVEKARDEITPAKIGEWISKFGNNVKKFPISITESEKFVSLSWLKQRIEDGMNSYNDADSDLSSLLCMIENEEEQ